MIDLGPPPLWTPPKPAIVRAGRIERAPLPLGAMLPGLAPVQINQGGSAINILKRLNLTSGLQLCLDAGDALSAPASATSWLDRSGNGYDFFRGTTSGAESSDPTFNGTVGGLSSSEYWSFDGGDWFTYDTTNETWMNNLHKDNALFSFIFWIYTPDIALATSLWGCTNHTSNVGTQIYLGAAEQLRFFVSTGSGIALNVTPIANVPIGKWTCVGLSIDEASGAGASFGFLDGATNTFDGTYSSPSAAAAAFTYCIAASPSATNPAENTTRMAMLCAWEGRKLSAAEMTAFYGATRGRFGV